MKIWGRINSVNVRKVLWCAEEIGLDYQQIDAGGEFGVVNQPDYLAKNPNGLVPCLEDGSFVLWESNTIVRYLARQYGGTAFPVQSNQSAAAAEKWMDLASFTLFPAYRLVFWNLVRRTPEERVESEIANGLKRTSELLKLPEAELANQPYLSGNELGIGDIPLACIAYGWFSMPIERPDMPNLEAWYNRIKSRPAYQKAVMTALT